MADDGDVRENLTKAMRLTLEKKFPEARAEYEAAVKKNPEQGVPALARFIGLTSDEAQWDEFTQRLKRNDEKWSVVARASAFSALGDKASAIQLLREDPGVLKGEPASATLLLARLLRADGDEEGADRALGEALLASQDRAAQRLLFDALTGDERVMLHDDADRFASIIDAGLRAVGTDLEALIRRMDPVIIKLGMENADYFKLRDALLALDVKSRPGAALFISRMIQREERPIDALVYLDPIEKSLTADPFWPALAQIKIQLLRSLGRNDDAGLLYQMLVAKAGNDANSDTLREAAGTAISTNDPDLALKYLSQLNMDKMSFDDRNNAHLLKLLAASMKADNSLIMESYAAAAQEASEDQLVLFSQAVFTKLRETAQHVALEKAIRDRFAADKKTPARLWLLAAAAAAEARRAPNQVEALYQYAQAAPTDPVAYKMLADVVTQVVETIVKAPPESVVASSEEIDNLKKLAEESLQQLVRLQPLDPEAYTTLIKFYDATGVKDVGARLSAIVADSSNDHRIKGVCGYALSTSGHAAEGLLLYDAALKIAPDDMFTKMNRAACLTHLSRFDEARSFYREILEKGDRSRRYHIHELIQRLWAIDVATNRSEEGAEYLKKTVTALPPEWRDEAMNAVANLFGQNHRYADAEPLFRAIIADGLSRDMRINSCENLGNILMQQNRFDDSAKVFAEAEELFADDAETAVSMAQARAQVLAAGGKLDEAVALLKELPSKHPKNQLAQNSLFLAAQLAEKAQNQPLAEQLYGQYLDSQTSDFGLRRVAEQKVGPRGS